MQASMILSGGMEVPNQRELTAQKALMTSQGSFSLKYIFTGHCFLPKVIFPKVNSEQVEESTFFHL